MTFIADFHIHSHFSRATSRDLTPEGLSFWARRKGIAVIGTGDFTHPGWLKELRENLVEAETGLYKLRPDLEKKVEASLPISCRSETRFLLSGEISCIYKRGGKTRKVHNLVLMPDFDAVSRLNERLSRIGNLRSDGRPILGLDSRDLLEIALGVSDRSFFIPAHIWTPWFSLFGSKSGFDRIEECFADLTVHIHALETGLSSDPAMNRRLSALDPYVLVSNSDAHSSAKLGREANLFDTPLDYDHLVQAMVTKEGFKGTIEFFPEEGKYHLDGHRKCGVKLYPAETREKNALCPACGKPLTVGVLHRVYELSDRESSSAPLSFSSLIPLSEILSEVLGCGPASKKVAGAYEELLGRLGPEMDTLMHAPLENITRAGGPLLAEAIRRMREGRVIREEGYDGEYGVIRLFDDSEKRTLSGQKAFFTISKSPSREPGGETFFIKEEASKPEVKEISQARFFDPILSPLNEAQRAAVLYEGGHLLILAGPGTGKTLTLTHRIAHRIRSGRVRPEEILTLTFTNKAAREMEKRLAALISGQEVHASTFHAFCLDVLRQNRGSLDLPPEFTLCSEEDALFLARQVMEASGKGGRTFTRFLKALPRLKRSFLFVPPVNKFPDEMLSLFAAYQEKLRSLAMLDLDDIEVETLRLFREHPGIAAHWRRRFPWIFVDEYQDTNRCQVEILKSLVSPESSRPCAVRPFAGPVEDPVEDPFKDPFKDPEPSRREPSLREHSQSEPCPVRLAPCTVHICAIGDPDQSIYGFRGSDVGNFIRFEKDFPGATKITLSTNYRSTQVILDGASKLLAKPEPLKGASGPGSLISIAACGTEAEEAEMAVEQIEKMIGGTTYFSLDSGRVLSGEQGQNVGFGDMAILFRLNAQGDAFEKALSRAGIPFVRSGEKPLVSRYPVDVLRRFLQTWLDPENEYYREAYHEILKHRAVATHPPPASSAGQALPPPGFSSPLTGEYRPNFSSPLMGEYRPNFSSPLMGEDKGGGGEDILEMIDQAVALHGFTSLSEEDENRLYCLKEAARAGHTSLRSFLDALSLERGIDHENLRGDRVALMSLHAAKGLEWPVVFVAGCEKDLLPCRLFGDRDDEEEKRLFYVGMTRACRRLILSHARRRAVNGKVRDMTPSPFLDLIPGNLLEPLERGTWKPRRAHKQLGLF